MLEFQFEGETALMKTKEGVRACDDAIRAFADAKPVCDVTFAATACRACEHSYQSKKRGLPIDALQRARDTGRSVLFIVNDVNLFC
jgi:hypothetical protein